MKTVKKTAKTTAVTTTQSSNSALAIPADFLAELRKDAVGYAASVKVQGEGTYISLKGGVFSFRGDNLGNEIGGVVLSHSHVNEYYEDAYDANRKGVTPACFSLSSNGENMTPHPSVSKPQSTNCAACSMSQIGSATVGKGRACKQKARVSFVHIDDIGSAEAATEATILQLAVPPMSKGNYTSFIKVVSENPRFGIPPYAVLTKLKLAPHPQYQYTLSFEPLHILKDVEVIKTLMTRARGEATELVMAPFQKKIEEAEEAPAKKKKAVPAPVARGGRSRFGG